MARSYPQTNLQLYAQLIAQGFAADDLRLVRAAHDAAAALFSGLLRFSGKPFIAHLVGTAGIVAAHGGDARAVAAALLHAAYEQGDFGTRAKGAQPVKRRELRGIVGDAVETTIARYHAFDFRTGPFTQEVRDLLLLRAANELEDALDLGVLYAAPPRRQLALASIRRAAEAAAFLDLPALEKEIREALASLESSGLPAALRGDRSGSSFVRPRSYRRSLALVLGDAISRLLDRLRP